MTKIRKILIRVGLMSLPIILMSVQNEFIIPNKGSTEFESPYFVRSVEPLIENKIPLAQTFFSNMGTADNRNHHTIKVDEENNYLKYIGKTFSTDVGKVLQEKPITVLMEIVPELMKFNKDLFTVISGKKVIIEIDNQDGMQHNLLIVKPGTLQKVGAAADAMLRDPKASEKQYVPQIPEVLFATKMLGPYEVSTLSFTAPTQPGDYPFVCTFPGHWRMMNGIMRVVKP